MENLFETLAEITRPQPLPKFYIEKTSGKVYFDELPKDTYFAMGVNGTVKNQAFWFGWDSGTCLIPFLHTSTNKIVIKK